MVPKFCQAPESPGGLVKQTAGPQPRADSVGLKNFVSNKLPSDADAVGPWDRTSRTTALRVQ